MKSMRNSYAPWVLSILLVILVLLVTMNIKTSITEELNSFKTEITYGRISVCNKKIEDTTKQDEEKDIENTPKKDEEKEIALKGSYDEKRKFVESVKQFKPASFRQEKITDYKIKLESLIEQEVPADNPELVEIIRHRFIQQPSTEPYNLLNPERLEFSHGQTPFIDSRLNYMEGGFYVECGALNGEKGSNSLFFERVRKWNGLLIEGDPSNYAELKKKHRKAFSVNACLSPRKTAAKVKFNKAFNMGRAIHNEEAERWMRQVRMKKDMVEIECFPLYSLMLALNKTTIDFFSLDVEGDELNVLRTIPFDKLNIKMLTVEYAHGGVGGRDIQTFLQGQGYEVVLKVAKDDWGVNDLIFRKKGLTRWTL